MTAGDGRRFRLHLIVAATASYCLISSASLAEDSASAIEQSTFEDSLVLLSQDGLTGSQPSMVYHIGRETFYLRNCPKKKYTAAEFENRITLVEQHFKIKRVLLRERAETIATLLKRKFDAAAPKILIDACQRYIAPKSMVD